MKAFLQRRRVLLVLGGLTVMVMSLSACGGTEGEQQGEPAGTNPAATTPGNAPPDEPAGGEPTQ